jgi:tetratricopeptide (TPR) repeat protein
MMKSMINGILVAGLAAASLAHAQTGQAKPAQGGQAQQQQAGTIPGTKSAGESQAVMAMFQAAQGGAPDAIIKASEDLMAKYADTTFKDSALMFEADAYQRKGDPEKAQIFAEQALTANPKNFQASILLADQLAQRTRENDLDREEKLGKVDKYANMTIDTLKTAPKPNPQLPDEQWEVFKKQFIAQAHRDLGLGAMVRKKYDVAITELKTAVDLDAEPTFMVQLANAYLQAGKKDEAAAMCDKALATPQLHPAVKKAAEDLKAAATKK